MQQQSNKNAIIWQMTIKLFLRHTFLVIVLLVLLHIRIEKDFIPVWSRRMTRDNCIP